MAPVQEYPPPPVSATLEGLRLLSLRTRLESSEFVTTTIPFMTATDAAADALKRRRTLVLSLALLVGGGVIWGATFSLAKLVAAAGVHPIGLAWLNGAMGALMLMPYCLLRFGGIPLKREYLRLYIVAGALGTALPSCFLFLAAAYMPAGVLAIIISIVPMATYAIALGFGAERLQRRRVFGIALGLSAMLMIVLPETSLPDPEMAVWVLIGLLAPLSYAFENVYLALRRPVASSAFVLLCGMLLAGAVMLTPLVWATDTWVPLWHPWTRIEWRIVLLIAINVACYLMFIELILIAGPVFAAQTGYLVTISGVLWGIAIFGEVHSAWVWAALATVFAGIALVIPRAAESAG